MATLGHIAALQFRKPFQSASRYIRRCIQLLILGTCKFFIYLRLSKITNLAEPMACCDYQYCFKVLVHGMMKTVEGGAAGRAGLLHSCISVTRGPCNDNRVPNRVHIAIGIWCGFGSAYLQYYLTLTIVLGLPGQSVQQLLPACHGSLGRHGLVVFFFFFLVKGGCHITVTTHTSYRGHCKAHLHVCEVWPEGGFGVFYVQITGHTGNRNRNIKLQT